LAPLFTIEKSSWLFSQWCLGSYQECITWKLSVCWWFI